MLFNTCWQAVLDSMLGFRQANSLDYMADQQIDLMHTSNQITSPPPPPPPLLPLLLPLLLLLLPCSCFFIRAIPRPPSNSRLCSCIRDRKRELLWFISTPAQRCRWRYILHYSKTREIRNWRLVYGDQTGDNRILSHGFVQDRRVSLSAIGFYFSAFELREKFK